MSLGLSGIAGLYCRNYVNQQKKAAEQSNQADFGKVLSQANTKNVGEQQGTEKSNVEAYTDYLKSKYGNVTIQSVGKDQKSLDRIGKSMSGNDVIIAPNILEKMANDPKTASYYEGKIDDFFNATPRLKAEFAAKGLDYQPCGVVVHEDGTVTYISGSADSPERVAEVEAINKAKREKEAAQRKAALERSQEAAKQRRQMIEKYDKEQAMSEALRENIFFTNQGVDTNMTQQMAVSAVGAYEASFVMADTVI